MLRTVTPRGFALIEFDDRYGAACNIQMSSLAEEAAIWLGLADANSDHGEQGRSGWRRY